MSKYLFELEFDNKYHTIDDNDVMIEYAGSPTGDTMLVNILWIETKTRKRRRGKATELLRRFKASCRSSCSYKHFVLEIVLTSRVAFRLFRRVFGKPVKIMGEQEDVIWTQRKAMNFLPEHCPVKDRLGASEDHLIEVTFAA